MTEVVVDAKELCRKAVTYIVEGLVVAIAAFALPKKKLDLEEVIMIACVAASTFALIDLFGRRNNQGVNLMADWARSGAGLGIGAKMVGFPN